MSSCKVIYRLPREKDVRSGKLDQTDWTDFKGHERGFYLRSVIYVEGRDSKN